jgi:hypothetical protein
MAYKIILLDDDINDDAEIVSIFSCEGHYDNH